MSRADVGGKWEQIGRLQFDFLVKRGLKSHHNLLDVGCGSLRGGVHFVRYLKPGRYYGVDRDGELLKAGRRELEKVGLEKKEVTLMEMGDFGFHRLGCRFDFALAQSVFTHLDLNMIRLCVVRMEEALRRGGKFYATFFENPHGKRYVGVVSHPCDDGRVVRTRCANARSVHYPYEDFEWLCRGLSLGVRYVGDWGHPRSQKMLEFVRK